ncbi:MAG: AAA family ATPase [Bacteroidota bacterium]
MSTPFKFGQVVQDANFINRSSEIKRLTKNFTNGINTILISPRRLGKTSLITEVARRWQNKSKQNKVVMIDLFSVRTEQEFYEKLLEQIVKVSYSTAEQWMRFVKKGLKRLRPKMELDPYSDPGFSITIDAVESNETREEILDLPQKIARDKGYKMVIALDEFQSIDHFDDPEGFQQLVRSRWQYHEEVSYCLYGSKKHMLEQYFKDASMPFYKFGDLMELGNIELVHWIPYLIEAFKKSGKELPTECAKQLVQQINGHPYYVQQLAWIVWSEEKTNYTVEDIQQGFIELLQQNKLLFEREIERLTNQQLNVLRAIAHEEEKMSSRKVLQKYAINSSSQVYRSLDRLKNEDLIVERDKRYQLTDPLMKRWIVQRF